jgi:hypothetical protein
MIMYLIIICITVCLSYILWAIRLLNRDVKVLSQQIANVVDFMWEAYNKNKSNTSNEENL